jgi:GTP-binding protein EngB required for normal cell division
MQITSYLNNTQNLQINSPLQDINQNLNIDERQILRKALMQVPSRDVNKVLEKIKQIPVDENYLKNIIQTIENEKSVQKEGFEIYA